MRTPTGAMEIRGATANNLQKVDVDVPLGVLCVITGVAGSGKSSLIHGSISPRDGVVTIDQGAIKGSRRSNPATYTGLLEPIRKAFAKANNVKPALFSANSEGACPVCNGNGVIYTELGIMDTVATTCEECEGSRYDASVLEHRLGGKDITEVLAMSVAEAEAFFGEGKAARPGGPRRARPPRRRRPRLPHARPAPHHAVRRRAPAGEARHEHGRAGRHLRARRADHRPPPGRRRAAPLPARPPRRLRQVGHRDRAPPGRDGPRRLDHRPRSRRRPRRRQGRLRGHPRRAGQEEGDPHRASTSPSTSPDYPAEVGRGCRPCRRCRRG